MDDCLNCGRSVPVTACGVKRRCTHCNFLYPTGDCSDADRPTVLPRGWDTATGHDLPKGAL